MSNSAVTSPVIYNGKGGYGYPSAYKLTPVPKNTGKAWGTLKGKGLHLTASTAWDSATDGTYSIRKTTNKNSATSSGYVAACNKSYLMVTGWLKVTGGTTLKTI